MGSGTSRAPSTRTGITVTFASAAAARSPELKRRTMRWMPVDAPVWNVWVQSTIIRGCPPAEAFMRVAIVDSQVAFFQGGAEMLVERLARAVVALGHDVEVVRIPFNPGDPRDI